MLDYHFKRMTRTGSQRSLSSSPRRSPRIEKRKQEHEDGGRDRDFKSKVAKLPELIKSRSSRDVKKKTKPVKVKSPRPPPQEELTEIDDGLLLKEIENDWSLTPPPKTPLPQTKSCPVQWQPRKLSHPRSQSPQRKNHSRTSPYTDPTYSPPKSRKNQSSRKLSDTQTDPPPQESSPPRIDPPPRESSPPRTTHQPRRKELPSRKLSKPRKDALFRKFSPPRRDPPLPREDTPSREPRRPSPLSTPPRQKQLPPTTLSPPEKPTTPWGLKLRKLKPCGSVDSVAETILLDDDDTVSSIETKKAVDDSNKL